MKFRHEFPLNKEVKFARCILVQIPSVHFNKKVVCLLFAVRHFEITL